MAQKLLTFLSGHLYDLRRYTLPRNPSSSVFAAGEVTVVALSAEQKEPVPERSIIAFFTGDII